MGTCHRNAHKHGWELRSEELKWELVTESLEVPGKQKKLTWKPQQKSTCNMDMIFSVTAPEFVYKSFSVTAPESFIFVYISQHDEIGNRTLVSFATPVTNVNP